MSRLFGRIHYNPENRPDWAIHELPLYVEELSDGYLRIIPPRASRHGCSLKGVPVPKQGFRSTFYLEDKRDLCMPIDRIAWELKKFMPSKVFVILQQMVFEASPQSSTPWGDPSPFLSSTAYKQTKLED